NLFDVADREEYLAYSRRSAREVARHGGRVVALGRFRESVAGDIAPRQVLILVEWESRAAFDSYRAEPALADLHSHRQRGSSPKPLTSASPAAGSPSSAARWRACTSSPPTACSQFPAASTRTRT